MFSTLNIHFYLSVKDTPKNKLQFNAGLIPAQIADIRSDHVTGAGKVNLFHATVRLDEANFLKPDFNVNSKEIDSVLEKGKTEFFNYINILRKKESEWRDIASKELAHLTEVSKALPNIKPVKEYYTSELDKIKGEFLEEKSIKEIVDALSNTFGAIFNSVVDIVNEITKYVSAIVQSLQTTLAGIIETIEKELLPPIKELADKVGVVITDIAKSVLEIVSAYLSTISQLIEKYQPQFKQIAAIFGEIGQDVARFIQNAYMHTVEILLNFVDKVYNEIKALPIYDELKTQYDEVRIFFSFTFTLCQNLTIFS